MRILFLTRAYGEHAGGMERLSFEFIHHVSEQPTVQAEVVAYAGARKTSPFFNLTALPKALAAARETDVIHLGDPMLSFLGWLLKKITKKPVAVTVHGLDITFSNFFYQLYLKAFFKKFDLYLPISQHVANLLRQHGGPAEMAGKFQILHPGISDRFYDPSITRNQLSELLKQDVANKIILFTSGRLVKRKGHEWFIREVLPQLPENVIYVIAGDGPEQQRLAPLLNKERSATSRVRYLGKVTDDQLKILYNTVDAFIMPNIPVKNDVEGFGLVLLEAALCNRPIFAADLEGIRDAVQNGQNGTLLPSQAAPAWLKALKAFWQNRPPAPSARAYTLEKFSWPVAGSRYTQILRQLIL